MPDQCECCHRREETARARREKILEFSGWQSDARRRQSYDVLCDACLEHYPHYTADGILQCPLRQ